MEQLSLSLSLSLPYARLYSLHPSSPSLPPPPPPVPHLQLGTSSTGTILWLLKLLNGVLAAGGAHASEVGCLLGLIPAVLPYVETHHPQSTRLQAAKFAHAMCTHSPRTLQMYMACSGLPVANY